MNRHACVCWSFQHKHTAAPVTAAQTRPQTPHIPPPDLEPPNNTQPATASRVRKKPGEKRGLMKINEQQKMKNNKGWGGKGVKKDKEQKLDEVWALLLTTVDGQSVKDQPGSVF